MKNNSRDTARWIRESARRKNKAAVYRRRVRAFHRGERTYLEKILNILYPKRCPVCHQILPAKGILVCPSCQKILHPIVEDYCLRCGKPVKSAEEFCDECRGKHREFDRGRGVFLYNNKMRQSLLRYKYYGYREYGEYYADCICRYAGREIQTWKPDLILPVPMHPRKQRIRGFNQAADLAEKVGKIMGIPISDQIVCKTKVTPSQKKLSAAERKLNLRTAFQVTERLDGLRILVIDDVYTTGSTIEAMAHILRSAGADKVFFVTLCMGQQAF